MRRFLLFATIVSVLLVRVAAADEPRKPESTARGILKITADRDSPLNNRFLPVPLVTGKSLLKEAISGVSKEAASEPNEVASVEPKLEGGGITTVVVNSYDQRVPADKLLAQLAIVLTKQLRTMEVEQRRDEARADRLARQVEQVAVDLAREHAALANLAALHRVSTNAELNDQKQMRLDAELQSLDVQAEGLKARREVIERQIAKLGDEVASVAADDPVLKELQKSVAYRKGIASALQGRFATGAVQKEKVFDAEDQLAQAEAEVARFRAQAAQRAGGGRIKELKGRLDDTAIELAEISARRDAVKKQLEQASHASGQVEIKRLDVERLKQDYRDASDELSKLRMKLTLYFPPEVLLVPLN
jgi:chromosome segregation ATPase